MLPRLELQSRPTSQEPTPPERDADAPRPYVVMGSAPPVRTALDRILHWFWNRQ